MQVQNLKLTDIKPYWRNPRINDGAVEAVKRSIEQYGFNVPLVVDSKHVLITGHTRYKALRALGYEEVPCVVSQMSAQKAKEYRLADNKTSELAQWDLDKLIPELREIGEIGHLDIFFPEYDLSELMADGSGPVTAVSQEQVDRLAEEEYSRMAEGSKDAQSQYIDLNCPHCGVGFALNRRELLTQDKLESSR